jgi:predicted ester cyclase
MGTSMAGMEHPNATLLRRSWAVYDRGEADAFAACLTEDWLESDPSGETAGIQDARRTMALHRAAFPDKHTEIHRVVADGDLVACHCTTRATHTGTYLGLEATGRTVELEEMMFCRVRDGRFDRTWVVEASRKGFYEQLAGHPYDGAALDNMG